jgi:hypothetical protein
MLIPPSFSDSQIERESLRLVDPNALELGMEGIQKIIAFLRYDSGRHNKDHRNVSDNPIVPDPLQLLGGWMITPAGREMGNVYVLHSEIIWKLRGREDEIFDGPVRIQMNVELERRQGNGGGCVHD